MIEEILRRLEDDPDGFAQIVSTRSDRRMRIDKLVKEYKELNRFERRTQIGQIQKEKRVGKEHKRVEPVRTTLSFQNKITRNATAFEVGRPVSLIPSTENNLTDEVFRIWDRTRMHQKVQTSVELRKSQLEGAVLFYLEDIKPGTKFNKRAGLNSKKDIKARVLDNSKGGMLPIYDMYGDMKFFCWMFKTTDFDQNITDHIWVYTDREIHKIKRTDEEAQYTREEETVKHGFDVIPIALTTQEKPEWYEAQDMIDRMEVILSKLGAANDYSGYPILMLYGEVKGAPDKDEDGKAFRVSQTVKKDGTVVEGRAEFLTYESAPESVRLELDRLEKYIYSMTSTTDINIQNIRGLGNISGYAIELMFMDSLIKAETNNTKYNEIFIERCLNIIMSGIVTTLATGLKTEAEMTEIAIKFNSILPKDLDRAVQTYMNGVSADIITRETAVKGLDIAKDVDEEIEALKEQSRQRTAEPRITQPPQGRPN